MARDSLAGEGACVPVAGGRLLHAHEPEVASFASEPRAPAVLELAAGTEPVHLDPIQEEGEAEGEAMVPLGDKLKGVWNSKTEVPEGHLLHVHASKITLVLFFSKEHIMLQKRLSENFSQCRGWSQHLTCAWGITALLSSVG